MTEEEHLVNAVESIDKTMRACEDCQKRAIVVTDQQYLALLARQTETYDTQAAALYTLFEESHTHRKKENGIIGETGYGVRGYSL